MKTALLILLVTTLSSFARPPDVERIARTATLTEWSRYGEEIQPGYERDLELVVNEKGDPVAFYFGEETGRVLTPHYGSSSYVSSRFSITERKRSYDGSVRYVATESIEPARARQLVVIDDTGRGRGWKLTVITKEGTRRFFLGTPKKSVPVNPGGGSRAAGDAR